MSQSETRTSSTVSPPTTSRSPEVPLPGLCPSETTRGPRPVLDSSERPEESSGGSRVGRDVPRDAPRQSRDVGDHPTGVDMDDGVGRSDVSTHQVRVEVPGVPRLPLSSRRVDVPTVSWGQKDIKTVILYHGNDLLPGKSDRGSGRGPPVRWRVSEDVPPVQGSVGVDRSNSETHFTPPSGLDGRRLSS